MKTKYLLTIILFTFTGCFFADDGPSEKQVKELVKKDIEGGLDAFCPSPEVLTVSLLERGNSIHRSSNRTDYPVKVEVIKKCGTNIVSRGETKRVTEAYNLWKNEYGDWRISKASLSFR